jgi:6-phosphogluconolactonase (cycloisomerase 2 family)
VALSAPARAELTLVEDEYDLVHLTGARGAVASPDGQHLYVRVPTASAIAIYARSAATGALTHLDSVVDGANDVMGLAGVADLAMSPNGASLYAFGPQGIAVFARSAATGQLTFVELESDGPSTLFANVTGGAVRANGANVYASSYDDSSVASFSRAGDGSLTYLGAVARVQTPQFGLIGADCVVVTPDSLDAYVCGALDRAVVYLRASLAGDGNLTATGYVPEYFVPGGAQVPLHGVTEGDVSSDGLFVYFAVDFARSIVAFTREPATSFLFHLQTVADGATPGGSRGPQSVRLHPSGRRLYASVLDAPSAENGALTAFTREADGTLSFLEALEGASTPGRAWTDPGELAISPDGAHLYAPDPSGFVKVLATNVVPEPGGLAAACVALAVLALRRRRSR